MKRFIIYDDAGNIKRVGYCPDDMVALQARAGEKVTEGNADDEDRIRALYENAPITKAQVIDALK